MSTESNNTSSGASACLAGCGMVALVIAIVGGLSLVGGGSGLREACGPNNEGARCSLGGLVEGAGWVITVFAGMLVLGVLVLAITQGLTNSGSPATTVVDATDDESTLATTQSDSTTEKVVIPGPVDNTAQPTGGGPTATGCLAAVGLVALVGGAFVMFRISGALNPTCTPGDESGLCSLGELTGGLGWGAVAILVLVGAMAVRRVRKSGKRSDAGASDSQE